MYTAVNIQKTYSSHIECLIKYLGILNVLNSLGLEENEIIVLAYTGLGGKTPYGMPPSTFYKVKKNLKLKGYIIDNKLHPQLHIDFENILLKIRIDAEKA